MRADTQFAVVEATLKGYGKWVAAHGKLPQQDVRIQLISQEVTANIALGATTKRSGICLGVLVAQSDAEEFRGV